VSLGRDRHQRLRAVFDEAVLQRSSARAIYLDEACASHPTLKPDVVRLLARHHDAGSFLERSSAAVLPLLGEEEPFAGTERFEVVQRLGAGGMGVVYEVHDHVRGETVALKTLVERSAADVYRLKREFRCLAGIAHPNLVCLYELFVEGAACFFTMERVKGVSFVEHARSSDQSRGGLPDMVRQLVEGVSSLHRHQRLHRDLKPSNILVTAQGRVVILDFGLIAEVGTHDGRAVHYVPGGTPAYVSPEEIDGADPSEASDWYSVGATLYQALTGVVPFSVPLTMS
jgi:serine/threonine protein kinase